MNRQARMTSWQIGTGVVVILCVVALLIASARRSRPRQRSDRAGGSDSAQVWMTGDPGSGQRDRTESGLSTETGKGSDTGDSGSDGGGGD